MKSSYIRATKVILLVLAVISVCEFAAILFPNCFSLHFFSSPVVREISLQKSLDRHRGAHRNDQGGSHRNDQGAAHRNDRGGKKFKIVQIKHFEQIQDSDSVKKNRSQSKENLQLGLKFQDRSVTRIEPQIDDGDDNLPTTRVIQTTETSSSTMTEEEEEEEEEKEESLPLQGSVRQPKYLVYECRIEKVCGGLADRFKGIVLGYLLAQATGRQFRISMPLPGCELSDLLQENTLPWRVNITELLYSGGVKKTEMLHTRMNSIDYGEELSSVDFNKLFKNKDIVYFRTNMARQKHLFSNPHHADSLARWRYLSTSDLYRQILTGLFKLTPPLQADVNAVLAKATNQKGRPPLLICAQIRVGMNPSIPTDTANRVSLDDLPLIWDFMKKMQKEKESELVQNQPQMKIQPPQQNQQKIQPPMQQQQQKQQEKKVLNSGEALDGWKKQMLILEEALDGMQQEYNSSIKTLHQKLSTLTEPQPSIPFYFFFVSSDSQLVIDEASETFGSRLVDANEAGKIVHVDKPVIPTDVCPGMRRVLVDMHVLKSCDVLLLTPSGVGVMASYFRGREEGLFCFDVASSVIKPCKLK